MKSPEGRQSSAGPISCFVRYEINPAKLEEFERYARIWIRLVGRHGGTHQGYFVSEEAHASARLSFPGVGREGPPNIGIALFSFPSAAAYERYRQDVREDPDCREAEALLRETQCFLSYERSFVRAVIED